MVRNYKRTYQNVRNGQYFRPYGSYSEESLINAVKSVQNKQSTLKEASEKYGVPISTISRKSRGLNNLHSKPGHPTLFSKAEENAFFKYMLEVSEWGFPFDILDLRILAQRYLSKIGRNVPSLKNNTPGRDWAINFMMRHKKQLSFRLNNNISCARAEITKEKIEKFFDNFETLCDDISPDKIINYDETNVTDDPGTKKFICKRGKKNPERVIDSTKSAISIMFAGAADGTLLNPYVVYKAEHLWDTWITGGPPGTYYNRSRSGWFDSICFEDWFVSVIVPYAKKKEGVKILVGDNLSSHFSPRVLELCQTYNIKFVCLPAKSTHIMQPLDVAFYAPLKHYWRLILTEWKQKEARRIKTLTKECFPILFSRLYQKLLNNESGMQNIRSGFEKCGLYPLNRYRPIERLPKKSVNTEDCDKNISSAVIDMLSDLRTPSHVQSQNKRKKRVNVSPGKSICVEDYQLKDDNSTKKQKGKGKKTLEKGKEKKTLEKENNKNLENKLSNVKSLEENVLSFEPQPSTSGMQDKRKVDLPRLLKKKQRSSSSSSNSSVEMSCHSDSHFINCSRESSGSDRTLKLENSDDELEIVDASIAINDDVLLRYPVDNDVNFYIGRIDKIEEDFYTVDCFKTQNTKFGLRFLKKNNAKVTKVQKNMIIKTVQLIETRENTFILLDSSDNVYFLNK